MYYMVFSNSTNTGALT